ncbi:MAG: DUF4349 domain-containing protein [Verrucomicrobiota bacterium]
MPDGSAAPLIPASTAASSAPPAAPAPEDNRKLIRDAQLTLEVKSYQATVDQVTALAKADGGYVDTSASQRGGNGKLQGTVVVKVLPQDLDGFLLKLRDLGTVKDQSIGTQDVTKDYYDTQARLVNAQKMEAQLQDLLKRENGKVSDLLAVERELGRVRGEIEQMQGQLKLYDFQVQYATVTIQIAEKDLKSTAAYLLKEIDDFSLFATNVEATFQEARELAVASKAEVLVAKLEHDSGSEVGAVLVLSVPPDQIEPFLEQVRALGRVANFTRDTKRVAQDGGDPDHPADETLTEKDKVTVNLSIRSDNDSRKQVALTVVAGAVDDALQRAKAAALAQAGVEILGSALNQAPQGPSTARLTVRVPGPRVAAVLDAFRALGRASSLTVRRNDDSGPGASGDDAPVILALSLTDTDTPVQRTDLVISANDVDAQAQQVKKDAGDAGMQVEGLQLPWRIGRRAVGAIDRPAAPREISRVSRAPEDARPREVADGSAQRRQRPRRRRRHGCDRAHACARRQPGTADRPLDRRGRRRRAGAADQKGRRRRGCGGENLQLRAPARWHRDRADDAARAAGEICRLRGHAAEGRQGRVAQRPSRRPPPATSPPTTPRRRRSR